MSAHGVIPKTAATLATLSLAAAAFLIGSAPVGAFFGRPVIGEFGSFAHGTGVTVDQSTGNVYVIDGDGHDEIQVFGPAGGAPVGGGPAKFDGSGNPAKAFKFDYEFEGPAFDPSSHVLWFPDAHNNNIEAYKLEGGEYKYICQIIASGASGDACSASGTSGSGPFDEPLGVALDTGGDLYVSDYGSSNLYEFDPAGKQIATFPLGFRPQYAAVGPTGTLYVNPYSTGPVYELKRSSLTSPVEGSPVELPGGGVSGLAVNETTGAVIVDHGSVVEELNDKYESLGATVPGALTGSGQGVGIDEATNDLYAVNGANQKLVEFGPGVLLPDVTTEAARQITTECATFEGTFNALGTSAEYYFEYGETTAYGQKTTAVQDAKDGPEMVGTTVCGLTGYTYYHYRLVGANENGSNPGADVELRTHPLPPMVSPPGGSVIDVSRTRAVLQAEIDPVRAQTSYYFEYGETTAYGRKTGPTELASSEGDVAPLLAQAIAGELKSHTIYHFRVIARNLGGTTAGPDVTFTSGSLTPPIVSTGGVSDLGQISVTLEGSLTTQGLVTSYGFEISTNPEALGPPTGLGSVGAGFSEAPVTLAVTGLAPKTTYYYKLIAINEDGAAEGEEHQFTTAEYPPDQISVEVLPVLNEPFTAWPLTSEALYLKEAPKKPATTCKKSLIKKHGQCVKKKNAKGKGKRKG
jgi:hypothetical protein